MRCGLTLLCEGDNAQKALENIRKAKNTILKNNTTNLQFIRLTNYESIVSCINNSDNKSGLTIEEIAQATGLHINYVKGHISSISLYALTPRQINELSRGRGKYAGNGYSDHTIPTCVLPRGPRRFISEI